MTSQLESFPHLTGLISQDQYTDRQNWPRPPSRLWSAHVHLGPHEPFVLELVYSRWHTPMDEPGTHRSRAIRVRGQSPDESFGLLRSRDGHIRNNWWEGAVARVRMPNCLLEGVGRRATSLGGGVHGGSTENIGMPNWTSSTMTKGSTTLSPGSSCRTNLPPVR